MSLQEVFYTLGIIVAIVNLVVLGVIGYAAWRAYQAYQTASFMAKKVLSNPLKFSSGLVATQIIGKLVQFARGRRRARVI